ncbi:olfactory receptor 7A10-like [Ochotona curzoniae]|uniref:olfactory receptor 7A10-like n=1 Tax=Ochotona curzoniae TaxID=130825 RepID=UPI001B351652|nr:olfactory receptor 7A10-like [Ochotona curzoniae]
MEPRNHTWLVEFLLLGFSEDPALQPVIFGLFLSMCLVTVSGNLFIFLAILSDSHLHTPMYFFLSNLSLLDISFSTTTILKMLGNIRMESIGYAGCITQMFFIIFAVLENFLLAVMAYDRFVTICHPLHHTVIMNSYLCVQLVLLCWTIRIVHALLNSLLVLKLSFSTHVEIPHFFCELNHVVHRACSDTFLNDLMLGFEAVLLAGGPLSGILYSYSKIISSIHAISSAQGKYKTFSTCASHLSVVSLFYGTSIGVYHSANAAPSSASIAAVSVMYTLVTPMLNPFVYSLRNNDIQRAVKIVVRLIFQGSCACHTHESDL